MKKVLALVLCVAMLACFTVTAMAAEGDVVLAVSSVKTEGNDTVTVTVSSTGAAFQALGMYLDYDHDKLEYESHKDLQPAGALAAINYTEVETENGTIETLKYGATGMNPIEPADLFTVTFKVLDAFEVDDTTEVKVVVDTCTDGDRNQLTVDAQAGTITNAVTPVVSSIVSDTSSTTPDPSSTTPAPSSTVPTPSKGDDVSKGDVDPNPDTGDAGIAVVAAVLCAAAGAAFVASKRKSK